MSREPKEMTPGLETLLFPLWKIAVQLKQPFWLAASQTLWELRLGSSMVKIAIEQIASSLKLQIS